MKKVLQFIVLGLSLVLFSNQQALFAQGSTTAALGGTVSDTKGETLVGASVTATHTRTGAQYATVSNIDGRYTLLNMAVGGPYTITVSYVGYTDQKSDNVYLSLGQTLRLDIMMQENAQELQTVEVLADKNAVIDGGRNGAETNVGKRQIATLPTLNRDLTDFTRLTPQASVNGSGAISIAGMNNRYNAIFIDGAVNNDVFGLSASGTNGGQANSSPISIDAIEQFQIVLAPYDVRYGGFAGGGINAVTRSGKNNFEGSVYGWTRNPSLAGKTPTDNPDFERIKLPDFNANTVGFRVGGPIIKNKLFFFVNGEFSREETPQPYDLSTYSGASRDKDATLDTLTQAIESLITKVKGYGYEPGNYASSTRQTNSDKFLARFDWNISKKHKLSLRHSYTKGEAIKPVANSITNINFSNNGEYFPSLTNSSALELKSIVGNTMSNNLILGYTTVKDDRDPIGGDFPSVVIRDGNGRISFGSEPFSTANALDQNIFTITDNFNFYKGKHVFTVGTHNEFYQFYNLFIRQNYGVYEYNSLADFMNDAKPRQFDHSYSLVDNLTGDGSAAAADFKAAQVGVYVQDEFDAAKNFKITAGVRLDVPLFTDQPVADAYFNDTALAKIKEAYVNITEDYAGNDIKELIDGIEAGVLPNAQLMWSPRLGFNWDVKGNKKTQLRGGIGIFTSRLPFVWAGGAFTNNGLTIGGVRKTQAQLPDGFAFNPDINTQATQATFGGTDAKPAGELNLFTNNFKYPQILRGNIGFDQQLPWGLTATVDAMYSKIMNNVVYYNINNRPYTETLGGNIDDRPVVDPTAIETKYGGDIYMAANTNKGYSYNLTAQLQKQSNNGLSGSIAYTFGRSMVLNDATSSQNSSQWRFMENVNGRNNLDLSISDFDMAHRIVGYASYRFDYLKHAATTLTLVYTGQSGSPFSYVYAGSLNREDNSDNDLIYIPETQADINLVQYVANGDTITAAEQWAALDGFIKNDSYLNKNRGGYAARNGGRMPFTNVLDLRVAQDFYIETKNGTRHNLQITFDVFNFTNLLNPKWGRQYFVSNDNYRLIDFKGFKSTDPASADYLVPTFNFTKTADTDIKTIDDSGVTSSRWQGQIGLRYSF
ncbi:MAG: carboxypeptidase regulatory-like domain-containing protein [Sphingobacteriales bacterium]|nr:carboxypeptidase regulatory-like domain-containing protein [Sphingobacteriales bacterium]